MIRDKEIPKLKPCSQTPAQCKGRRRGEDVGGDGDGDRGVDDDA